MAKGINWFMILNAGSALEKRWGAYSLGSKALKSMQSVHVMGSIDVPAYDRLKKPSKPKPEISAYN